MKFAKPFLILSVLLTDPYFCADQDPCVAAELPESTSVAKWIWTPVQKAGAIPNGACFFRRTFEVSRTKSKSILEIAADDSFEAYVNGQPVGRGEGWRHFTQFDISDHVQSGKNVVAVKVVNLKPGDAGLAARIQLSGRKAIPSDESWRTTIVPLSKWKHVRFADRSWRPAVILGEWNKTSPWVSEIQDSAIVHKQVDDFESSR